jgi:hypothetical protein
VGGPEGQRVSDSEGAVVEPSPVLPKPPRRQWTDSRGGGWKSLTLARKVGVVADPEPRFSSVAVYEAVAKDLCDEGPSITARPERGRNREAASPRSMIQSGDNPCVQMFVGVRVRPPQPLGVGAPPDLGPEGREDRRRHEHRHRPRDALPVSS